MKQLGRLTTLTILGALSTSLLLLASSAPSAESPSHQYTVAANRVLPATEAPAAASPTEATAPSLSESALSESNIEKKYLDKLLEAELALSRDQPELALANYIWVAKQSQDPKMSRRATEIALSSGNLSMAQEAASLWAKMAPKDLEAQISIAAIFIKTGETKKAVPFLEQIQKMNPKEASDHYLILYKQLEDVNDRAQIMEALEQLKTNSAYLALSEIYLFQSESMKALSASEKALKMDPNNNRAMILYTQSLMSHNKIEEAKNFLNSQIQKYPNDTQLKLFYVEFYYNQGIFDKARTEAALLSKMKNLSATEVLGLARLSMEAQWYLEAELFLKQVVSIAEHQDTAHYFLGRLNDVQKKHLEAIKWYMQVQNPPFYVISQIQAALLYNNLHKPSDGLRILENIEASSFEEEKQITLAKIELLSANKQNAQALTLITQELQNAPDDIELLYSRAIIAQRMNDIKTSEQAFKAVLEKDPTHINALNGLGFILADQSTRYQEAEELLSKANNLSPNNAAVLDSMGWLQFKMGNAQKAVQLLKQALSLSPDPEIAAHLKAASSALKKNSQVNNELKAPKRARSGL